MEGLLNKLRNIGRQLRRQGLLNQPVGLLLAQAHEVGQLGKGGLHIVLCLAQQQSAILDVDPGKADIQVRAKLVAGHHADLVQKYLPRRDGLLRDPGHRLGLLTREEGPIDRQQDLLAGGLGVVGFGLRPQFGAAGQVGRPAKISDELREHQPLGVAVEDTGVVEGADGREPGVLVRRAHCDDVGGQGGEERRPKLPGHLASGQGLQIGNADLRMAAERGLVRFLQSELWRVLCVGNSEHAGE